MSPLSDARATTQAPPAAPVRARVRGIVRGREIDAYAAVSMIGNALVLAWESATPWELKLDGLDGLMPGSAGLTLYLNSGDVLELSESEALRALSQKVLDCACAVPELTRGLRALGSQRGSPGPAHDRWFAPLLAARRAVAGITDADRQVALIDAPQIATNMQRALTELAKEQAPNSAPMQRAIEAALLEESEPVFVALERLALASDALRGSALDTRLSDWRRFMAALREVFAAADNCWPQCALVLAKGV